MATDIGATALKVTGSRLPCNWMGKDAPEICGIVFASKHNPPFKTHNDATGDLCR